MLTDLSLRVLGRLPADDCVGINESWWKLASRPPVKHPSAVCGVVGTTRRRRPGQPAGPVSR